MDVLKVANNFKWDCCPLCKSGDIYRVGKLNYLGKINFSTVEVELNSIPELWKCQRCGSGFVQNIVDADTARKLYSMSQAGERWQSKAFYEEKTAEVVQCIADIFKFARTVLDVGCNTGELLDFALGFGCETSGVEFSSASREVVHRKGHRVYSTLEGIPGRYDVITAFDVVEHLYDAPAFMEDCIEKLADKGRLVVSTGNIDCLSAKMSGAYWWYAQFPEHVVFPSKKYFSDYSGLRIENWIPIYAAKSFEFPIYKGCLEMLKGVLRGRTYTGLPSLVPDHALIILKK